MCIDIMCMTRDTPIPQQLDNFWVSLENKLARDIVCNGDYVNNVIIASYVVPVDEVLPVKANGGAYISKLLKTGSRLVMHVVWVVLY